MKLSLSVRIAEDAAKRSISLSLKQFAELARRTGYHAVCMRASAGGVQTAGQALAAMRAELDRLGLAVSMATTDFEVPLNNDHGPDALRDFEPHLQVADLLGATLIRVCMKTEDDIAWASRAADQAAERGIRIAHQCHTTSLFETVDGCLDVLKRVDRKNFGIIYEPANLMLCGQPYGADVLKALSPYLMNVYLQNHRLNPDGTATIETWVKGPVRFDPIPLWEPGGVDLEAVFDGLSAIRYQGYVTVHQAFAELAGPREAAEKSHAYLTRLTTDFEPPLDSGDS